MIPVVAVVAVRLTVIAALLGMYAVVKQHVAKRKETKKEEVCVEKK